jgi:hypothetical protein
MHVMLSVGIVSCALSPAGPESNGRVPKEPCSDVADHGSNISDRDELQKVRILNLNAAPYLFVPALYQGISAEFR